MEDALIYIPGSWICSLCQFVARNNFVHRASGISYADTQEIREYCPNDQTVLRKETWRERAERQEEMIIDLLKHCKGN